jgi:hypothetical protein
LFVLAPDPGAGDRRDLLYALFSFSLSVSLSHLSPLTSLSHFSLSLSLSLCLSLSYSLSHKQILELETAEIRRALAPLRPRPPPAPAAPGGSGPGGGGGAGDVLMAGDVPRGFVCPITLGLMTDPVMAADGHRCSLSLSLSLCLLSVSLCGSVSLSLSPLLPSLLSPLSLSSTHPPSIFPDIIYVIYIYIYIYMDIIFRTFVCTLDARRRQARDHDRHPLLLLPLPIIKHD